MKQQVVTILGGTGFIGRYVVRLLAAQGYTIRIISRKPDAALHLKTAGSVGQIVLVGGNLAEPESLAGQLENSYAVINLVGILFEAGRQNFTHLHAQGAEKLAKMAKAGGVQRFVHMSALGIDKSAGASYARSKLLGEKAVLAAFPQAAILRPGVIFGPEDHFFNQFAAMASLSPVLPLIGGGRTRFQPIYVGDVAQAIQTCITAPETAGRTYELGGPHIYTLRELMEYTMKTIHRKRALVSIPFGIAALLASLCELMPRPPLTRDQVKLLRTDNIVTPNALTIAQLGIAPTALEVVVPEYLARFNKKQPARVAAT